MFNDGFFISISGKAVLSVHLWLRVTLPGVHSVPVTGHQCLDLLLPTRGHQRPPIQLRALYNFFIHHYHNRDEMDTVILTFLMRKHRLRYLLTSQEYKGSQRKWRFIC